MTRDLQVSEEKTRPMPSPPLHEAMQPLQGEIIEPTRSSPATGPRKVVIKKYGFLGAFLRPIGIVLALLVLCWGLLSMGTSYYRGYQRHLAYSKDVHADQTYLEVLLGRAGPALSTGETKFVYRDVDGRIHRVVAATSAVDNFVNETLIALDRDRDAIVAGLDKELSELFEVAFSNRDQVIDEYADWFFEWKRSYVILKEAIKSTASRLVETGKYESLKEAVERDIKDYFLKNYTQRVLKPEERDQIIATGVENMVRSAHARYKQSIARSNERLQQFLLAHTRHLEEIAPGEKATQLVLDWDAQKWKAPSYTVEDRAFEGIVGVGTITAGGTFGALALGPLMSRTVASTFASLSRTVATSMGSRIALAEGGAAAGTLAAPGIGTAIGAGVGVALGVGADYLLNKRREKKHRESFVEANSKALDLTIQQWQDRLNGNIATGIDRWFEDARAAMILSHGKKAPRRQREPVSDNAPGAPTS